MAKKRKPTLKERKLRSEVRLIVIFAISGIVLLALIMDIRVGIISMFTNFLKGIFGYCAYFIPIIIPLIIANLTQKSLKKARFKNIVGIVLSFLALNLFVFSAYKPIENISDYNAGVYLNGAGQIGNILGMILSFGVGRLAALIMGFILLIIAFVTSTGQSFFAIVKDLHTRGKKSIENTVVAEGADSSCFERKTSKKSHNASNPNKNIIELLSEYNLRTPNPYKEKMSLNHKEEIVSKISDRTNLEFFSKNKAENELENEMAPVFSKNISVDRELKERKTRASLPARENPTDIKTNTKTDKKTDIAEVAEVNEGSLATTNNSTGKSYILPKSKLLNPSIKANKTEAEDAIKSTIRKLQLTLDNFNVKAKVVSFDIGPSITMYEVVLAPGVKIAKLQSLSDDIALSLAASTVRIAAIPGKSSVGIEVPNNSASMVMLRDIVESRAFKDKKIKLAIALGKDISGQSVVGDLASMPHVLIAGATGSGKSVCVNSLIISLLLSHDPSELKFLMIDPKIVELSGYNGIAHLIMPVVTDPKKASAALNWVVQEMETRYEKFAENKVKEFSSFNKMSIKAERLPYIVVIIDELADLMMIAPKQVEDSICRIAQKARAAGIHLVVATQRPSVDVITGLIKANIPSRVAFAVSSQVDSRTIIDMGGAEKLLGKGDMLYYPTGASKPRRVQGAFISGQEVDKIVESISGQNIIEPVQIEIEDVVKDFDSSNQDELLQDAINFVIESRKASGSALQRKFNIGYNRAARLIDFMEEKGIIGPSTGTSKPREVLVDDLIM